MHAARAQPPRDRACLVEVAGLHVGGQAKGRVIGDADGLFETVKLHQAQHRAKDFLARDAHLVVHVGEQRGARVVTHRQMIGPSGPTGNQLRAFGDPHRDAGLHLFKLHA